MTARLGVVIAALAVGLAVWGLGRLRPNVEQDLARKGVERIDLTVDTWAAVERVLARDAVGLGGRVVPGDGFAAPPELRLPSRPATPAGYLPPRPTGDGWRLIPTPDALEAIQKRAYNRAGEALRQRGLRLPEGRWQVTFPDRQTIRLEATADVDPDWLEILTTVSGDLRIDGRPVEVQSARAEAAHVHLQVDRAPPGSITLDGRPTRVVRRSADAVLLHVGARAAAVAAALDAGPIDATLRRR